MRSEGLVTAEKILVQQMDEVYQWPLAVTLKGFPNFTDCDSFLQTDLHGD